MEANRWMDGIGPVEPGFQLNAGHFSTQSLGSCTFGYWRGDESSLQTTKGKPIFASGTGAKSRGVEVGIRDSPVT